MMKKHILLLITIIFSIHISHGQNQMNHWEFGNLVALDFTSGTPVAGTSSIPNQYDGTTSISDASGNLLFYSDGQTVWNSNNIAMPNGTGLHGSGGSGQSSIVFQKPGSSNLFYLFTMDGWGGTGYGCNYSVVDMSLQGGLGNVTTMNTLINNDAYERMTLIRNGNGIDAWLIIVDWSTDNIYAYAITSAGVNLVPVASNVGSISSQTGGNSLGPLKVSPLGDRIACGNWAAADFHLFNFNNATGVASNPIVLHSGGTYGYSYGTEFSPDGTKLYAATSFTNSKLFQFDLSAGSTAAAIMATQVTLSTNASQYAFISIQRGPNNKIYVGRGNQQFLGVINNPNVSGIGCNYVDNGVTLLAGTTCRYGLPSFINNFPPPAAPIAAFNPSNNPICEGNCLTFTDASTNAPNSWSWVFAGSSTPTSTLQSPTSICYSTAGTFPATLYATNANGTDSFTINIVVNPLPTVTMNPVPAMCTNQNPVTLVGTPAGGVFTGTGVTGNSFNPATAGVGTFTITYTFTSGAGCSNSVTINDTVNAVPLQPTITGNGSVLMSSSATGNQWYLNGTPIGGATSQFYTAAQNGFYTVVVTINGCSSTTSAAYSYPPAGISTTMAINSIHIFPSLFNTFFTVVNAGVTTTTDIQIVNVSGEKVFEKELMLLQNQNSVIDMSSFPSGIYFVKAISSTENSVTKIVKQ